MKISITHIKKGNYYNIILEGEWTITELNEYLKNLRDRSQQDNCHLALIDIRKLSTAKSKVDRFRVAENLAKFLHGNLRVASINHQERIDGLIENAARNRGLDYADFSNPKAATNWLLTNNNSR